MLKVVKIGGNVVDNPVKLDAFAFDQFRSGYYRLGEKVGQAWNSGVKFMK